MADPRLEDVLAAIMAGHPDPGDDGIDHQPDPPAWDDAESDRAADRYEAWRDRIAEEN